MLLTLCQHYQGLPQALLLLHHCCEEYGVGDKNNQGHYIIQCARSPRLDSSNLRMFRWIKPFLHASSGALNVLARMWVARSELGNQRQRLDPSIKKAHTSLSLCSLCLLQVPHPASQQALHPGSALNKSKCTSIKSFNAHKIDKSNMKTTTS